MHIKAKDLFNDFISCFLHYRNEKKCFNRAAGTPADALPADNYRSDQHIRSKPRPGEEIRHCRLW